MLKHHNLGVCPKEVYEKFYALTQEQATFS